MCVCIYIYIYIYILAELVPLVGEVALRALQRLHLRRKADIYIQSTYVYIYIYIII